jgi:Fe(3+) dicitrate transport protein
VQEDSHETYAGLLPLDFEAQPYRRYTGSRNDHMESLQRQGVLTHTLVLNGGWKWINRAYLNRFDRNWYKVDRVAASGEEWVKLGALLDADDSSAVRLAALSVFRDGEEGEVRLKNNNRAYWTRGLETRWMWEGQGAGWQRFEAAVRLHEDGMDRFQWADDWRMVAGQLVDPERGTPGEESNRLEWSRALAGYAQARWSRKGWSWIPGVRVESILAARDDFGNADVERTGANLETRRNRTVAVLPGMGVRKALGSEWSAFAGVHRGVIPPGSSQEVEPEYAWNSECGFRWVRAKAEATTVAFAHFGRNLQGSDFASSGGSGDGAVFNGGSTRVLGLEAMAQLTNGVRPEEGHRLELGLTYTFTDGRFTTSFESDYEAWGTVQAGDAMPYLARHQGALRLGWARSSWSVDASVGSTEGMRVRAGSEPLEELFTVGGNTVLDASVRCQLGKGFGLEMAGRNLLDAVYIASARPAGVRPGMPRTVTGGFNFSF